MIIILVVQQSVWMCVHSLVCIAVDMIICLHSIVHACLSIFDPIQYRYQPPNVPSHHCGLLLPHATHNNKNNIMCNGNFKKVSATRIITMLPGSTISQD